MTQRLITTSEAAAIFRVHPKTVKRWARGWEASMVVPVFRTPGGHLRLPEADMRALARGSAVVGRDLVVQLAAFALSRHWFVRGYPTPRPGTDCSGMCEPCQLVRVLPADVIAEAEALRDAEAA